MRGLLDNNSMLRHLPLLLDRRLAALPLVARWKLDEAAGATAADSIGSLDLAHTDVAVNQPSAWGYGKGALYNGSSSVSMSAALPPITSWAAWTMLAVVRTGASVAGFQMVMQLGDGSNLLLGLEINAGQVGINGTFGTAYAGTIRPHTTYVLILAYRSGRVYAYVNGVEYDLGAMLLVEPDPQTSLGSLVEDAEAIGNGFTGVIDEAMVFDGGLSGAQATSLSRAILQVSHQATINVDRAIAGKLAATKPIYSTKTHATATYVRDATNWAAAAGIDLTGIVVWNSRQNDGRGGGVFVAPDILIAADHYNLFQNGDTLRVVRTDGTVETLTVHSSSQVGASDIQVVRTTASVSANIKKYKVLPADWANFFAYSRGERTPVAWVDQTANALVADVNYLLHPWSTVTSLQEPTDAQRLVFYELPIAGDSGCAVFMLIEGELVLLATWYNELYGPAIHHYATEINAAITALGSAGSLTTFDLSNFAGGG